MKWSLNWKVIAVSLLFLSITIMSIIVMINQVLSINEIVHFLGHTTVEQARLNGEYNTDIQRLIAEVATSLYREDEEELEEAEEVAERIEQTLTLLDQLEADISRSAFSSATDYEAIQQRRKNLFETVQFEAETATSVLDAETTVLLDDLNERLEDVEKEGEAIASASSDRIKPAYLPALKGGSLRRV